MARNHIYYRDRITKAGDRERVLILPAQQTGASVNLATGRPAFGAEPPEGSLYRRIPKGIFFALSEVQSGYEKRPVGMPDAPSMTTAMNLTRLAALGGDLASLVEYLMYPLGGTGRVYHDNEAAAIASGAYRTFDAPNVFIVLSDRGDRTRDFTVSIPINGAPWCEFIGVQRRNAEDVLAARRKSEQLKLEITLIDAIKFTLETVTASDIEKLFLQLYGNDNTTYKPAGQGYSGTYYNYIWRHLGVNYADCVQTYTQDGQTHDRARYYRLPRLWSAIGQLCQNVWSETLKVTSVNGGQFSFVSSVDTSLLDPTPYEHITYFRQAYDLGHTRGAALDRNDMCFQGVIWDSGTGNYAAARPNASTNSFIGGYLIDHSNEGSLHHEDTRNVWDLLVRATKALMRVEYLRFSPTGAAVYFLRLFDAMPSRSTWGLPDSIRRKDLKIATTQPVELKLRSRGIRGCDVTIPNSRGSDVPSLEMREGTLSEEDETITLTLHNLPRVGDDGSRYQMKFDDQWDLYTPFVASARPLYDPLMLCYFDTPTNISKNEIPIKPHDHVGIDLGFGTIIFGSTLALTYVDPVLGDGTIGDGEFDSWFYLPIRARSIEARRTSCLAFALARRAIDVFGRDDQYAIEAPIRGSLVPLDAVGNIYQLANADGTTGTPAIFLSGSALLTNLPAKVFCVQVSTNRATGESTAVLLGVAEVTT